MMSALSSAGESRLSFRAVNGLAPALRTFQPSPTETGLREQ